MPLNKETQTKSWKLLLKLSNMVEYYGRLGPIVLVGQPDEEKKDWEFKT